MEKCKHRGKCIKAGPVRSEYRCAYSCAIPAYETYAPRGVSENAVVLVHAALSSTNALPAIEYMLDETGKMKSIEKDISSIMQGSIILMAALDEIAKLHPFIGGTAPLPCLLCMTNLTGLKLIVAVLAFKACHSCMFKCRAC